MQASGYSGTPLAKKLGIKSGLRVKFINEPKEYLSLFTDLPDDIKVINDVNNKKDFIHYFVKKVSELDKNIHILKLEIEQNGMIWISWPKKSAKVVTDLDGNIVREIGLAAGLVDIKVCSINEVWSGLKFVIPLKDRK